MKRLPFFFFILCCCDTGAYCQQKKQHRIDSLVSVLHQLKEDSVKVKLMQRIASNYVHFNPARGFPYAQGSLELSRKINYQQGIGDAENILGALAGDTGSFSASRQHFLASLDVNRKAKDSEAMLVILNNIARTYGDEGDLTNQLTYSLQSFRMAKDIGNPRYIASAGTNLCAIYLNEEDYTKGLRYALLAKSAAEQANSETDLASAVTLLGFIRIKHDKDTAGAAGLYRQALGLYQKLNDKIQEAYTLTALAATEYPRADAVIGDLEQAQRIYDQGFSGSNNAADNLAELAQAHRYKARGLAQKQKKAEFDLAARYLDSAIAITKVNTSVQELATLYQRGAELEADRGNFEAAYQRSQSYQKLNDSLFSQEHKNQLAGIQGKYDLELKDKEIALGKLEVSAQRRTQWALAAGILLLVLIGGLLLRLARQRKKTNTTLLTLNGQLDEANKIKARFFGILSHDLRGPISNLLGFLHLVREDPDALNIAEQADHQRQIARSAEELLETMESMLIWSKEQMDEFKPDIKLIPVADLFAYLEKFFGSDRRARIRFSDPGKLTVSGDENYLRVIMQNLTSNALKALNSHPDGLIEWNTTTEGEKTILSIKDNGPGISAEKAKTLFSETSSINARNGFGLHLVRDLAKAIRYQVSVETVPGVGTTFHLAA